jgi:hypothetical protein
LFEFKHSTNSFKSRLSGIVSRSFPNLEEDIDSLAWCQPGTKKSVRVVGFLKAVEDSDDLLHLFHLIARTRLREIFGLHAGNVTAVIR